jgi:hypothetical protein
LGICFFPPTHVLAQDYSEQAKGYFRKFFEPGSRKELINHLPTLDECKMVFTGLDAFTYYGLMEAARTSLNEELKVDTSKFVDVRVTSFSTQDIDLNKKNYPGGMTRVRSKLQPYVVFYQVSMLRTADAIGGYSYKHWVCINGRWVFFPQIPRIQ